MGADRFIAFYGIRLSIENEDDVDEIDERTDARLAAAKKGKLHWYVGRLTDGETHFLFVGKSLGIYGVENNHEKSFDLTELEKIAKETNEALRQVSLEGKPQLWFQLEAQY